MACGNFTGNSTNAVSRGQSSQNVYNRREFLKHRSPRKNKQTAAAMPRKLLHQAIDRLHRHAANSLPLALPLIAAALLPLHAEAANWSSIGKKTGTKIEVDTASLVRVTDDKFRVWYRESYAKPQIIDSGAFSFSRLTVLSEFHCSKRLMLPVRRTYLAGNGSELKSENFESKDATPVIPDSVAETVFNFACKEKLSPEPTVAAAPPPPVLAENSKTAKQKSKAGKEEAPPAPPPPPPAHWEYEGKAGAAKWGKLSEDYAVCGIGQRQSPIDIRETIGADLPSIRFAYKAVPLSIVDNGHTIQVNVAGTGSITVDGEDYELLQFHFHKPSEEKINGKTYDMVAHLVHKSKAGKLAVVAVMLQAGKEQSLIRTLWNNLPLEQNKPIDKPETKIDPTQLLPEKRSYFTYIGSLTTPPCSEGVLWLVLKTPTQASKEQIAGFGKIYKNNARPIQSRGGRVIKESR
jgi:carbonic anhydrase